MKNKIYIILLLLFAMVTGALAQNLVEVSGKVLDEKGEPIIGASIVEAANPTNGISSDVSGRFRLKVKSVNATLNVFFIGYQPASVVAEKGKELIIRLKEDQKMLDEVQVTVNVGYGTQSRVTHTGSTSQVTSKELMQSPAASLQNALVGKMPGLFQQQTSGQPGNDAANIYIRGVSTYANVSKQPLVLVDDIEVSFSTLSQLDANEVESLAILKDASSTAIFGVKGANGVVLVRTKRGKQGPAKITVRSEVGFQQPTINRKNLSSYDALLLLKEQSEQLGKNPLQEYPGLMDDVALEHFRTGDMPHVYPNVNWYDEIMRKNAMQLKENIDISGGVNNVKYFLSLGYLHQEGILKKVAKQEDFDNNYYLKRYNIRSNIDVQVTKLLDIKLNASARLNEINEPYLPDSRMSGGAWPFWRRLSSGLLTPWDYPVHNANGTYGGMAGKSMNPVALLEYGGYERTFKNDISGNVTANHKLDFLTKGLSVRGTLALSNNWGYERKLTRDEFPDYTYNKVTGALDRVNPSVYGLPPLSQSTNSFAVYRKINTQFIVDYKRSFGSHNLSGLALANYDTFRSGAETPANFKGYSGRISYDYKFRYMLEFNMAYNGSDRFKSNKKYGFFPAVSAGWNISEEPFFKNNIRFVDFLKVRGSIGEVGSDAFNSAFRYLYEESYILQSGSAHQYYFGEQPTGMPSIYPGSLGNDNVTWEKEKKMDLGMEMRLFKSKLSIVWEYFNNERYDILTNRGTIADFVGMGTSLPPMNLGRVQNHGQDLEVSFRDKIHNVDYFVKGNVSYAENKILEMDEPVSKFPLQMRTGRPVGQIFGYVSDGFYYDETDVANSPQVSNRTVQPGDLKYRDVNGPDGVPDGVISEYDIVPIGNPNVPKVTFGVSTGFSFKGFDFSILFQGATKGSIMSATMLQIGGVNGLPTAIHQERWTTENRDHAEFPRLGGINTSNSTFWLRPSDYVRLKNIELGYNLPSNWIKGLKMSSARFYCNGLNLFTWSNMKIYDVDPESSSGTTAAYEKYPQMKMYNFGLQVTF